MTGEYPAGPLCQVCDDTGWTVRPHTAEDGREVTYAERCHCYTSNPRYQRRRERETARARQRLAGRTKAGRHAEG